MSELSTVAIKDGHRGHLPHHQLPLEAERADRISRLAGLERVATARQPGQSSLGVAQLLAAAPPAYFDSAGNANMLRERSTVGSASATGSVGGRTTWASGSDVYDPDKMSEEQDVDGDVDIADAETASSLGGFSDEGNSLVAFGEGARTPARQQSSSAVVGSPGASRPAGFGGFGNPAAASPTTTTAARQEAHAGDGIAYDPDAMDTVDRISHLANEGLAVPSSSETGSRISDRQLRNRSEHVQGL